MKTIQQKRTNIKHTSIISLAVLLILSTITVSAIRTDTPPNPSSLYEDEWAMTIENTVAEPGEIGHTIPINGVWAEDIMFYALRIEYDPEMIEVTEVNVDGCVGENGQVTAYYFDDYFTVNVMTPDDPIPAGNGKLANLIVNITTGDNAITWLNFSDSGNFYVNYDSKVRYPTLYNGIITITSSQIAIESISGGVFFVKADLTNIGDEDITDVPWSITLNGGFIFTGEVTNGTVDIPSGETVTIRSKLIFGLGKTRITVIAESAEETAEAMVLAVIILLQ